MSTEAEILYDMSKEFEILKEQCLFQHNILIDANNQIYICLQDKIYILSLRKIALNKCVLQDVIDCTKIERALKKGIKLTLFQSLLLNLTCRVQDTKDRSIVNHFVDEITHMYNSKSASSQEEFASFVLKDDKVNMMQDKLLRQRLVGINNDILTLKVKNFKISKYGLLPGNHPIITILLNNGDAYNLGYIKSGQDQLNSYQIMENLNSMITGEEQSNLEIMSFEWSSQFIHNQNVFQLQAVHASNGFVYLYHYQCNQKRRLINKYNVVETKSKQIKFVNYMDNSQSQLKIFILTGKNITVIHLIQNLNNNKPNSSSIEIGQKDSDLNLEYSLVEIKHLNFQFIDRLLTFDTPINEAPILYLTHNQEIYYVCSKDYTSLSENPKQTFGGCLGKILAVFENSASQQYQVFNEKSQIQIFKNSDFIHKKNPFLKIEHEVYEEEEEEQMEIEGSGKQMASQVEEEVQTFSSSMFLPYGVIQSINQCFYIVCGAHSFTSQQLTNLLIVSDSDNLADPCVFMSKCFKNLEKNVHSKNPDSNSENQSSNFVMIPFNWDDVLFYILKNQNQFVDILKVSLFIYDQQKGIKKLQADPQLEKFDQFLKKLNIPLDKLSFINEKLLLFLTSMQKQQFKDFIDTQKQTIITRNYQSAYAQLKKYYPNSALFKRLTKEVDLDILLQKISINSEENVIECESITCILTTLDITEEPMLKCKCCKHYMIDLERYIKQDPSNSSINIMNVFQFRNNICPLCCGLVVPLIS